MGQVRMRVSLGAVALVGATTYGIGASISSAPSMMTRADYEARKLAIDREALDRKLACEAEEGAQRSVCQAEARAAERVRAADLEARYRGTFVAAREANLVRIDARYDIERSRCFAYSGFQRDNCVIAAHAARAHALMATKGEG